jgi:hypothetical protein
MESIIKYVVGEMRVIAGAPATFVIALLALAGAIWWALDWKYSGVISNKDSEISLIRGQRDDYKDKLSGATPDQAKARIDNLEQRLVRLARRVEPRGLTQEQRAALSATAKIQPGSNVVTIAHEGGCTDCPDYAADLEAALRQGGWKIHGGGVLMGVSQRPATGLALMVGSVQNLDPQERTLKQALESAKISFDILEGKLEQFPSLLLTGIRR